MKQDQERYHEIKRKDELNKEPTNYYTEKIEGVYCFPKKSQEEYRVRSKPQQKKSSLKKVVSLGLVLAIISSFVFLISENIKLNEAINEGQQSKISEEGVDYFVYAEGEHSNEENLSIPEIAKRGKPSVVAISTEVAVPFGFFYETTMPVAGSGFFISEDGYIATNNHVVEGAKNITVHTDDGQLYDAEIVGADALSDLAVIKVEPRSGERFPAVRFGDSDALVVGELAVAIGNPSGTLEGSVTAGIISALGRTINVGGLELNVLQTDAAINAGNSGGALFNSKGEVVGVNTAKLSGYGSNSFDGIAFAIPSSYAEPILTELLQYGTVTNRVQIGISGRGYSSDFARRYNLADRPGILVAEVLEGSSADDIGIRAGDFIVEMDGRATDSIETVQNMKKNWAIGDRIEIVYFRKGEKIVDEMTLKGDAAWEERQEETTTEETTGSLDLFKKFVA